MLVPIFALPVIRTKLAAAVLLAAAVTPGHAVAKNHDVQQIRIPAMPTASHDRVAGPSSHRPT